MNLSTPLAWNDDVLLVPVGELPDDLRSQIDCGPEDFALSRPQARTGSKILDADAADLVGRFREPRTIVEAVILYGRAKSLDPEEVLEGAFPLLRGLLQSGFLVPAGGGHRPAAERRGIEARWTAGDRRLGATVTRVLQVLEDTEVYLLERDLPDRKIAHSVLKIERRAGAAAGLGERLRREGRFLARLDGSPSPRLLAGGGLDGTAWLEIEWIAGIDAVAAAADCRRLGGREGARRLLDLCRRIADTYAALHALGVLHGDVHPSNVLVERDGRVRLIDLGMASALPAAPELPAHAERGGIPFFYEPELARAFAGGLLPPAASAAGEQYAVAVLLYLLATGAYPRDYSLGREEMLREIGGSEPLSFRERGAMAWPRLEEVLRRALSSAPEARFPSMAAFAAALATVEPPAGPLAASPAAPALDRLVEETIAQADLDGPWLAGLSPAPTASITYGAAGLGLALLKMGLARDDARLLSLAGLWTGRAARAIGGDEGFYNPGIDISRPIVGESSPYHTPSGVHAAAALVARATGDPYSQAEALQRFLAAAEAPANGIDLTLGRASLLLGSALLLDAVPSGPIDPAPLRALGDRELAEIWRQLDAKPAIPEADVEYLGIAHGWAGFLYATLQWCRVAGREIPDGVERRLAELAALALPSGRGLQWPWTLTGEGRSATMPGWCNGACGYVFLWTLADSLLGAPGYLDLAVGAAFESSDSPETAGSLCCGLAGRGYALLNLYRHTGETLWLDRARDLAHRAATASRTHEEYPHSLWKGTLGIAALAVDLERPEQSATPFFEPFGYSLG
jgi:serine/threonine-protein kinase